MHWKSWLKILGLALLAWLLSSIDWRQVLHTCRNLDPRFFAAYAASLVAMLLLRARRLQLAVARVGTSVTYRDACVATLEPAFLGAVTPGRLGEFSRVGYLHAHGLPLPRAVALVAVERLLDILLLLGCGAVGLAYIYGSPGLQRAGAAGGLFAFAAGALLLRRYSRLSPVLDRWAGVLGSREPAALRRLREQFAAPFHDVVIRTGLMIYGLGAVCLALNFLQVYLLGKAFGFTADGLVIIFAYATATLVALLPISVGGLGTREATYIMIMGRVAIAKEQALLFSLIDGFVLGPVMLLLLLLPLWIPRWLARRRERAPS